VDESGDFPVDIFRLCFLHARISPGGRKIGPFVSTVQRHGLTAST
jgi:hypothetical protein